MTITSVTFVLLAFTSSLILFAICFNQSIVPSNGAVDIFNSNQISQLYDSGSSTPATNRTKAQRGRIALARTFCEVDAMDLVSSFDVWDKYPPCHKKPEYPVDIIVSFSRNMDESPIAQLAIEGARKRFEETRGWNGCFDRFIALGVNIPDHLDIYSSSEQSINPNWVNGPNRQFEKTIRMVEMLNDFELMYLMEGDSVPLKKFWLDAFIDEINQMRPFAILGSSYRGDKWDSFYNKIPSSLIHHTNGNAVYNITHPFFMNLLGELESEANTAANNIAFDHRMQQIIQEGIVGVPSRQVDFPGVESMPDKTDLFQRWMDEYPPETVVKESVINGNYAATNMVPELINDKVYITHGAKMYKSWDCDVHGDITLVVSDWNEGNSRQMLSSFGESKHPFCRMLVMQPDNTPPVVELNSDTPVDTHYRGSEPDFMDFCNAPVKTEWFMLTNSYFRLRPIVTIMVDEIRKNGHLTFRPIASTVDADDETCFSYESCVQDLNLARRFLPSMLKIFQSDNMLFNTSIRDKFCNQLKSLPESKDLVSTPATAYMAFVEVEHGGIQKKYRLSDRRKHGSRFHFVPLSEESLPPVMADQHRRHRQLRALQNNATECTAALSELDCGSIGCDWNADFGSCRDPPELTDGAASNATDIVSKSNLDNSTDGVLSELNQPMVIDEELMKAFAAGNTSVLPQIMAAIAASSNSSESLANFLETFGKMANTSASSGLPSFNGNFSSFESGDVASLFGNSSVFESIFGNTSNFLSLFGYNPIKPAEPDPAAPTSQPDVSKPDVTQPNGNAQQDSSSSSSNNNDDDNSNNNDDSNNNSNNNDDSNNNNSNNSNNDDSDGDGDGDDNSNNTNDDNDDDNSNSNSNNNNNNNNNNSSNNDDNNDDDNNNNNNDNNDVNNNNNNDASQPDTVAETAPPGAAPTLPPTVRVTQAPTPTPAICTVQIMVEGKTVETISIPCP